MFLGSNRRVRVFACTEAVDLRKGYDGLYGLVASQLGSDPLSGDLFLFLGRTRKLCKVLMWDGTGLCIFQKRLERGRFANLHATQSEGQAALTLTASELSLFIEGCDLVGRRPLSPDVVVPMSALDAQAARDARAEHGARSLAR
jgi:transposase